MEETVYVSRDRPRALGGAAVRKHSSWILSAGTSFFGCIGICALTAVPATASTTLTFKEPSKGATYGFIDVAPKSPKFFGIPKRYSPGDEMTFGGRLESGGRTVGKIGGICTATRFASSRNTVGAGFVCTALAKVPGGSLVLVGPPDAEDGSNPAAEGAVTGGTGKYAGARGTFAVKESAFFDTNTITLLE
jgi:hypothetical protein